MSKHSNFIAIMIFVGLLCLLASCGGKEQPPRTRDEIFRARSELPALYLTLETKQRVIAPAGKSVFVDQASGEVCWRASACNNPDCPGREDDGQPFVFIAPDYGYFAKNDGTLGHNSAKAARHGRQREDCPECLKNRDLGSETVQQRQQYVDWVRPYELPEAIAGGKELDEELKRRNTMDRRHRVSKPTPPDPSQQPTRADPGTRPSG